MNLGIRTIAVSITLAGFAVMSHASTTSTLQAVPFTNVRIADRFWTPRQETNRNVSIPHSLDMLERAGNLHDLDLAAAGKHSDYKGPVFIDSDLYKALEAASYSLSTHPDAALEKRVDAVIAKIAAAQMPDGYLNTWFQVNAPDKRWTNLRDQHELYCAGHLFEAAAAHHAATGKRTLLDIATRFADCIDSTFGPPPKRPGYCGHPEIELALVKLARATKEDRYLRLARFFVDSRGSKFFAKEHNEDPAKYDGSYWQDNAPIRDHKIIVGHAVRAVYLMSGATDIAMKTGDAGIVAMLDRVWNDTVFKKMYVTGGIGSSAKNEGFTTDYDLPNMTAYQETCASIAMVQWNHRMAMLHRDAKYADGMELALYNSVLSGVSLDGKRFFYENRLASKGDHHRLDWYGCACCPPNITRTLASLGQYAYVTGEDAIWLNLYVGGEMDTEIAGHKVSLDVKTDYPWDGRVTIRPQSDSPINCALRLRKPEWCADARVSLNGTAVPNPTIDRGYIVLQREWKSGDEIVLEMAMPARRVAAHPAVPQDRGLYAIQRGPLVYCLEDADNATSVGQVAIPLEAEFSTEHRADLLGGVTILRAKGLAFAEPFDSKVLYAPPGKTREMNVTAIPYCVWDNRAPGEMRVWVSAGPVYASE